MSIGYDAIDTAFRHILHLRGQTMDILFLLKPGFTDSAHDQAGKRYDCPSCAYLEGVLA